MCRGQLVAETNRPTGTAGPVGKADQALLHLPVVLAGGGLKINLDQTVPSPGPLQEAVNPDLVELVYRRFSNVWYTRSISGVIFWQN